MARKTISDSRQPERDGDQQAHRDHGDQHVEEQLVRFLGGGLAVVAGDVEVDVGGDDGAFERLDAAEDVVGDVDGVGAFALGDGERDGGQGLARGGLHHADILGRLVAAIDDFGHVADEDGPVAEGPDDDVAHVVGGAQELAGFEEVFAIAGIERAGGQAAVGEPERAGHLQRRTCGSRRVWLRRARCALRGAGRRCRVTAETSGTCLMVSSSWAAMRRSSKSP